MKHIPNILSAARIVLSFLLPVLTNMTIPFLIVYAVITCGNIANCWLARRLHTPSERNTSLDCIGDVILYCVSLYIIFFQLQLHIANLISMLMLCVFVLKLAALFLTRWKYHVWASMHTIANKATDVLLFLLVPFCILTQRLPLLPIGLLIACSYLATFEEMLLVLSRNTYDIHTRSLLAK